MKGYETYFWEENVPPIIGASGSIEFYFVN